jgi:hypothetical protein
MKYKTITHKFVDTIPNSLEEGTIYISMYYATAVHKCFCGCGNEVVTPLSPTDWKLTYDGESISLNPSIGNWGFPCMSHYWIRNNEVQSARKWNKEEVDHVRKSERVEKDNYFKNNSEPHNNLIKKLKKWFSS